MTPAIDAACRLVSRVLIIEAHGAKLEHETREHVRAFVCGCVGAVCSIANEYGVSIAEFLEPSGFASALEMNAAAARALRDALTRAIILAELAAAPDAADVAP